MVHTKCIYFTACARRVRVEVVTCVYQYQYRHAHLTQASSFPPHCCPYCTYLNPSTNPKRVKCDPRILTLTLTRTLALTLTFTESNAALADSADQWLNILQSIQLPFALLPVLHFTSNPKVMGRFANTLLVQGCVCVFFLF